MPNQPLFPKKDSEFNVSINFGIPYLTTNKARLCLTPASQSALTTATTLLSGANGWNVVYPQSQNPATATVTIIAGKNTLRTQIEGFIKIILGDIPKSVLTQVDRDTLNLPLPATTHTPAQKPTSVPTLAISTRGHLSITLSILDTVHSQTLTKLKDADSIELEGAFVSSFATASANFPQETDFKHLAIVGKSTYTRNYSIEQLKGTEYIRARYLSSRNEPGNWSEWIVVVVS